MDIKESIGRAYKWPFHVDEDGVTIHDDEGNYAITVRGWSRLSQLLEHDEAFKLQLEIAHFLTGKLNELGSVGKFYSNTEIENIKSECYQAGMNAH